MSLAITCAHCKRRLDAWPVDRCPACGCDPHAPPADDSPTTEWPVPLDLWEHWEDPDVVEE